MPNIIIIDGTEYQLLAIPNEPKQVSKDYEILSFKGDGVVKVLPERVKYFLMDRHWKIHSVKRLNDNEVFTIGEALSGGTIIKGFELANSTLQIHVSDNISGWYSNIQSLVKNKQPLFTTEQENEIISIIKRFL